MKIVKWLGFLGLLGGLLLAGFQGIAMIMGQGGEGFYTHTLVTLFGEENFAWVQSFPVAALRSGIEFVVQSPIYGVMICVGILLLIIHGLFVKG